MEFVPTRIPDVVLIKPEIFADQRGYFLETWQAAKFVEGGIPARFVQDNHSHSTLHTLRGMHYQIQHAQGKLVRATRGAVFDVAVDMRRSSPYFGHWVGVELSENNHHMLWVPPGFAHGFLALSDAVDFVYKCTDYYSPQHECTLRWDDPEVKIEWPLPTGTAPLLAPRDSQAPRLSELKYFP